MPPAAKEAEHEEDADGSSTDARVAEKEGTDTADDSLPKKTDDSAGRFVSENLQHKSQASVCVCVCIV